MNQTLLSVINKILSFCFYLSVLVLSGNLLEAQICDSSTANSNAYGNGSWIGHVYDHGGTGNPVTTPFATYKGYTTETEIFNRDWEPVNQRAHLARKTSPYVTE